MGRLGEETDKSKETPIESRELVLGVPNEAGDSAWRITLTLWGGSTVGRRQASARLG